MKARVKKHKSKELIHFAMGKATQHEIGFMLN
jgi:hypothetical protein